MAIKFSCRCGKHLKARESSAGRLTQCPRCGEPVAIPVPRPTHRGTDDLPVSLIRPGQPPPAPRARQAPHPPQESRPRPTPAPHAQERAAPPSPDGVSSLAASPPRRSTEMDRPPWRSRRRTAAAAAPAPSGGVRLRSVPHWWRLCNLGARRAVTLTLAWSFGFTLGTIPTLLGLGAFLGLAAGVWLRLLPEAMQSFEGPMAGNPFFAFAGLAAVVLAGYAASLLGRVLAVSARPRAEAAAPNLGLDAALLGLAVWIGCFLAGPVLLVALAYVHWTRAGALDLLDAVILAELLIVAVGYWLVALAIVTTGRSPLDATPVRVFETAWRLGRTGLLVTIGASAVLACYASVTLEAAALMHQDEGFGYLLLPAATAAAVGAMAVLFRVLGAAWTRVDHSPRGRVAALSPAADNTWNTASAPSSSRAT